MENWRICRHPTPKVQVSSVTTGFSDLTPVSDLCAKNPGVTTTQATLDACSGAFLLLHVTEQADFYGENIWGWTADHEMDRLDHEQVNIYTGR